MTRFHPLRAAARTARSSLAYFIPAFAFSRRQPREISRNNSNPAALLLVSARACTAHTEFIIHLCHTVELSRRLGTFASSRSGSRSKAMLQSRARSNNLVPDLSLSLSSLLLSRNDVTTMAQRGGSRNWLPGFKFCQISAASFLFALHPLPLL